MTAHPADAASVVGGETDTVEDAVGPARSAIAGGATQDRPRPLRAF